MCVSLQSGSGFLIAGWLGSKKECPKRQEVGAASFLRSGPGNWAGVTSAELCSQTDPRFKVRECKLHCQCIGGGAFYKTVRDPQSIATERGLDGHLVQMDEVSLTCSRYNNPMMKSQPARISSSFHKCLNLH